MENKTQWIIDPSHSEITFKARHLMISTVRGKFREFSATVWANGEEFIDSTIEFSMNPNSIDTGEPRRDDHLRSADFFDSANHPEIIFVSESFKPSGVAHHFDLKGLLTIRGIPVKVQLDAEFGGVVNDPFGDTKAGFTITGNVNRKDWGLNWNAILETGGVMVGDDIGIICDVELKKVK